jgi:peptidyl-dipeptidase A
MRLIFLRFDCDNRFKVLTFASTATVKRNKIRTFTLSQNLSLLMKRFCSNASLTALLIPLVFSCQAPQEEKDSGLQQQADTYLSAYNTAYQKLRKDASESEWVLNTRIVEGDTATQHRYEVASQKLTDFLGSRANIDSAKKYLEMKKRLSPLQVREFDAILFAAGGSPETAARAVKELIEVSGKQTKILYGYDFKMDGKSVTKNDINNLLTSDAGMDKKLKAWNASKEVAQPLTSGI